MKEFFQHQAGVSQALDLMPVVTGRFISLNGKPVEQMKGQHFPRRMLENAELSWADAPPDGDKVTQGKWWTDAQCGWSWRWARAWPSGCTWAWVRRWNWKSAGRCGR